MIKEIKEIRKELEDRIWEIGISEEERFNRDCTHGLFVRLFMPLGVDPSVLQITQEAAKEFLNSGFKIPEPIKNKILLLSL